MAKLTVSGIKKQIAALEAKAAAIAQSELKGSIARVKSLMDSLGVTVEHLSGKLSLAAKKGARGSAKPVAARRGAGVAKYRDPETGATWTGFGRAPVWIASAKDRDQFLIGAKASKPVAEEKPRKARKPVAKKAAPVAPAKKAASTAPAKKAAAKKVTAKKVASKKVASEKAPAAKRPVTRKSAAARQPKVEAATAPAAAPTTEG